MQMMYRDQPERAAAGHRTWLGLGAAGLLLASVVLHLVAMFPRYFGGSLGQGSAWSQSDQAALFAVLTAGWALAFGLFISGPGRARLGAAMAVGLAVTELGFRVTDVGEVLHYGTGSSSVGMWLMTAGWAAGAAGAIVAVLAVHDSHRRAPVDTVVNEPSPPLAPIVTESRYPPVPPLPTPSWEPSQPDPLWEPRPEREQQPNAGWPSPWASDRQPSTRAAGFTPPRGDPDPLSVWAPTPSPPGPTPEVPTGIETTHDPGPAEEPTTPVPADAPPEERTAALPFEATPATPAGPAYPVPAEATAAVPVDPTSPFDVDGTSAVPVDTAAAVPSDGAPSGAYGVGPTALVAVLAVITTGAFLPAWDHYVGILTTTGRSVSFSLGNAFSGPWPVILGNVLTALALVAIPILVTRLRDRSVAALVVVGSLVVLASQFTSAIVQANQPVSPSIVGLTPAQAAAAGLQLRLSLTGWFTLDVLAAYGLFVAVMVIGYLRPATVQENSAGTWPSTPEARSPASLPWS